MASYENNGVDLVEIDLEEFEIDGALLREILGEQDEGKDDNKDESLVEEANNKVNPNIMKQEHQQQQVQQSGLDQQYECHNSNDLEWLNVMDMMMVEPTTTATNNNNNALSDVIMNWFNSDDDFVGMVDFGYASNGGECNYSQMCDGFVSNNEAIYGGLWENYGIN